LESVCASRFPGQRPAHSIGAGTADFAPERNDAQRISEARVVTFPGDDREVQFISLDLDLFLTQSFFRLVHQGTLKFELRFFPLESAGTNSHK
jgi:hypothetical protein